MKLDINWSYVLTILMGATIITPCLLWYMTFQAKIAPGKDYILIMAMIYPLFLGGYIGLLLKIYRDYKVEITDDYISRPSFFLKENILQWDKIEKIKIVGFGINMKGNKFKISLTPYAYKQPDEIYKFIESKKTHNKALQ